MLHIVFWQRKMRLASNLGQFIFNEVQNITLSIIVSVHVGKLLKLLFIKLLSQPITSNIIEILLISPEL